MKLPAHSVRTGTAELPGKDNHVDYEKRIYHGPGSGDHEFPGSDF
jgi:hypothetical protein